MSSTSSESMRMGTSSNSSADEQRVLNRIRAAVEDWAEAHRTKDARRVISHYGADIVQFVLAPPLQLSGAKARDQRALESWFSSFKGPIGYEVHDLKITSSDGLAFCHFLSRFSGTSVSQGQFVLWNRVTLGLRWISGEWLITHVHSSVPFYMDGSFRAAVDLKPYDAPAG